MGRYRRIEYVKCIGCHHDDEDNLTGGYEIPMVALFDEEQISESQAREMMELDMESQYLMLITKAHYDSILKPAVEAAIADAKNESPD